MAEMRSYLEERNDEMHALSVNFILHSTNSVELDGTLTSIDDEEKS
jgi:hypothetical protein